MTGQIQTVASVFDVPDMPATLAGIGALLVVAGLAVAARLLTLATRSRAASAATVAAVLLLMILTGWNLYLLDWDRWAKVAVYAFVCLAVGGMAKATKPAGGGVR